MILAFRKVLYYIYDTQKFIIVHSFLLKCSLMTITFLSWAQKSCFILEPAKKHLHSLLNVLFYVPL